MLVFITINELSLYPFCNLMSHHEIKKYINEFVESLLLLDNAELISSPDLYSDQVFNGYGIEEWLKSEDISGIHKSKMRNILQKCTYIYPENFDLCEYIVKHNNTNIKALGCLSAYLRNEDVISFNTHNLWREHQISGYYTELNEETEEINETYATVDNYIPNRFDIIVKKAQEEAYKEISSGLDLWESKDYLFPNLQFSDSVKNQLIEDSERFHIVQIINRLKRINHYFENCGKTYNNKELGMGARTESETVKNNPKLKALRRFRLPNGNYEYFFDHISFSGKYSGARIYFLPLHEKNSCVIGYIGRHLKSKMY